MSLTFEQRAGLTVAKQLIDLGIPVFAAAPSLDGHGRWDPKGGHGSCGYWLPKHWEKTVPSLNWLNPDGPLGTKAWRPGYALAAVMGHGLDLLDVDPRNDGDTTRDSLIAAGQWPTVYATATTPSGGVHEFMASVGQGSLDGVRPGLDVKGGKPDGTSRGFAFIAPTVKLSKATGALEVYRWTRLPEPWFRQPDDSGRHIAAMIEASRYRPEPVVCSVAVTADPGRRLEALVQVVMDATEGLDRNKRLFWAACRGAEMVAAGQAPRELIERALTLAGLAIGQTPLECRGTIESAFGRPLRVAS